MRRRLPRSIRAAEAPARAKPTCWLRRRPSVRSMRSLCRAGRPTGWRRPTAGGLKGGLGTASFADPSFTVGALAAVNSMGEVVMPGTRTFWTWWLEQGGELGGQTPPVCAPAALDFDFAGATPRNTTLGVIATDAALDKGQARRVAIMAQDGLARSIRPVHGPLDGDTVFVLSTGARALEEPLTQVGHLGALAADALSRAVMRGVFEARSLGAIP